jgi:uncharacterized protein (DUF1501 family)
MVHIISRRTFLGRGLAGFSVAATAPAFLSLSSRVFAGAPDEERILVVLQLSGGNDGMSMLVPYGDPTYRKHRNTTALADKDVLKLDDYVGLHPEMKQLHSIFGDGRLALVQGVSYPNPNRSHFRSMDIWHTGDQRGRAVETGWIGRAIDSACPKPESPTNVVNLGTAIPYALEAKINKPISFESAEAYRWAGNPSDKKEFEELNRPVTAAEQIDWLHRVAVDARDSSEEIRAAARDYKAKAEYPRSQLAGDLRTVAALINAGLKTRVYYVSFGGFDTHNGQANRYANLMRQLDPAVGAFYKDLRANGTSKKVLLMSFSEFGRRVDENASGGTDHGVAGPMLLIGDGVKGGLHGKYPSLTDLDRNGDLQMQVDFRSVYTDVLDDWMSIPAAKVLGNAYPKLHLL